MSWIAKALGIVITDVSMPGWVVLAGAILGALLVFLLLVKSEPNDRPLTLLVLIGILLAGLGVGSVFLRDLRLARITSEARDLEKRATTLDEATATAGLGCLNADESLAKACEAILFESPANVAAARGLVRARLALVNDAFDYVRRRGATAVLERVAVWRRPLELDPYGIVASVLLDERACTPSSCPQLAVIGKVDQITANMADNRYGAMVARYAPLWERTARNHGTLAQPERTGPFGFAIVDRAQPASAPAEPAAESPSVVNMPVENAAPSPTAPAAPAPSVAAPPPFAEGAPLPPTRPPVSPPRPATDGVTNRTLVPRTPLTREPSPAAPESTDTPPPAVDAAPVLPQ